MTGLLSRLRRDGEQAASGGKPPTRPRFKGRLVLSVIVVAGVLAAAVVQLASVNAANATGAGPVGVPAAPQGWSTVFSDDFTGAAGAGLDSRWKHDTGPASDFGTGEAETMTDSASNVYTDGNGDLDISALDTNGAWTSGQFQTTSANVGAPADGELEVTASIKQPSDGYGYWPSFWMIGPGQWPASGEIDILQDVNSLSETSSALHCGTNPGGPCDEPNGIGSGLRPCPGCQNGFHTYTMILNRTDPANETITFYLDGNQYFQVREGQIGAAAWQAAYDHNLSIVFDLAIGGTYPQGVCHCTAPASTTRSGRTMSIAYVAAYTANGGTGASPTPATTAPGTPKATHAATPKDTATSTPVATSSFSNTVSGSGNATVAANSPAPSHSSSAPRPTVTPASASSAHVSPTAAVASGTGPITGIDGLCIDVKPGTGAYLPQAEVATCDGSASQTWTIDPSGNTVTIHSQGECLDVYGGATAENTAIDLYPCDNDPSQVWVPESNGALYYPHGNLCLDDYDLGGAGTVLQTWTCNDGLNQQWALP
jgi:Ricin-type beta-trefoil lectin domain/Glycosyl hydrolases family 16